MITYRGDLKNQNCFQKSTNQKEKKTLRLFLRNFEEISLDVALLFRVQLRIISGQGSHLFLRL